MYLKINFRNRFLYQISPTPVLGHFVLNFLNLYADPKKVVLEMLSHEKTKFNEANSR